MDINDLLSQTFSILCNMVLSAGQITFALTLHLHNQRVLSVIGVLIEAPRVLRVIPCVKGVQYSSSLLRLLSFLVQAVSRAHIPYVHTRR